VGKITSPPACRQAGNPSPEGEGLHLRLPLHGEPAPLRRGMGSSFWLTSWEGWGVGNLKATGGWRQAAGKSNSSPPGRGGGWVKPNDK